jgi:hypothetical protein
LGIAEFGMQYEEYRTNPVNQILNSVAEEPTFHPLVLVPRRGEGYRKGVKGEKLVRKLIAGLEKLKPGRVCDLVFRDGMTLTQRDANKKLLLEDNEKLQRGDPHKFDIVVAVDVVREGMDWVICDRIHESAPKSSITLNVQTLGRMFRKFHGKTSVIYCAYIPSFIIPKGHVTRADLLSDRTRILLFFLVVDSMVMPCTLPRLRNPDGPPGDGPDDREPNELSQLYDPYPDAFRKLTSEVIESFRCNKCPAGTTELEHAKVIINAALVRYETPEEYMSKATAYFLRILINLFSVKKVKTPHYDELAAFLAEMGPVLFEGASSSSHYGSFDGEDLERFYGICSHRFEAFYARKSLRPSYAE